LRQLIELRLPLSIFFSFFTHITMAEEGQDNDSLASWSERRASLKNQMENEKSQNESGNGDGDVNGGEKPVNKNVLLWEACTNGDAAAVKELLKDPEVDPNYQDPDNKRTPLYRAAGHEMDKVVALLCADPRVDVNLTNYHHATPLFISAQQNCIEVVRQLAGNRDVQVNIPREKGQTPLAKAADKGLIDVVSWILLLGRNVSLTVQFWKVTRNVADLVEKKGLDEMAQLLRGFERNPEEQKKMIMMKPKFRDYMAAYWFSAVILLCDDYLKLSEEPELIEPPAKKSKRRKRKVSAQTQKIYERQKKKWQEESTNLEMQSGMRQFLKIAIRLPLDLQMLLCNRLFGDPKDFISKQYIEPAISDLFRDLAQQSENV